MHQFLKPKVSVKVMKCFIFSLNTGQPRQKGNIAAFSQVVCNSYYSCQSGRCRDSIEMSMIFLKFCFLVVFVKTNVNLRFFSLSLLILQLVIVLLNINDKALIHFSFVVTQGQILLAESAHPSAIPDCISLKKSSMSRQLL